jgi:hypothetical protein
MKQVTIRFSGRTGSGKTRLAHFFMSLLRSKGFKIADWSIDDGPEDWIVVEHDGQTLVEGTKIEKEAA